MLSFHSMDYSVYVAKTFTVAFTKIGPVVGFIVMGYFIFIKLPFLIFRNSLKSSREFDPTPMPVRDEAKPQYNPQEFQRFMNSQARLESSQKEEPKKEQKEQKKEEPKKDQKKEERGKETRAEKPSGISPEEVVFQLQPGQRYTKDELKKRYRDLLKESHPDKVAAMGADFKKLAEHKTKEINSAYEKLKVRAA
jgi:DnaJ-domain-containing protein 1